MNYTEQERILGSITNPIYLSNRRYNAHKSINTPDYDVNKGKTLGVPSFRRIISKESEFTISLNPVKHDEFILENNLSLLLYQLDTFNIVSIEKCTLSDDSFRDHLKRLYWSLFLWESSPGEKLHTSKEILTSTLLWGPKYAASLKKDTEYGLRHELCFHGSGNQFKSYKKMSHYNAYFPVDYLIHWEEIPDDWKYMQIPLEKFSPEYLIEFEETVRNLLPDDLEEPDDIEILAQSKATMSFNLLQMKNIPFYKERMGSKADEFSECFIGKRCFVPIAPANTRDAVVTTIDTYNSVKYVDMLMLNLLDQMPNNLDTRDSNLFNERIHSFTSKPLDLRRAYYMRDIEKCGLTMPRELVHIINNCIIEKYQLKHPERLRVLEHYALYDREGKAFPSIRGYTLGMGNRHSTLIQLAVYNMLLNRIPISYKVRGMMCNDDYVLEIKSKDIIEIDELSIIDEIDADICKGLNIRRKDMKTFFSRYSILFEQYSHPLFKAKEARAYCAFTNVFIAPHIRIAKILSNSLSSFFTDLTVPYTILNAIISLWGFEYYPDEVKYDYSLGGWLTHLSSGISTALREIYEAPENLYTQILNAIYGVEKVKQNLLRPTTKGKPIEEKNYSSLGRQFMIQRINRPDLLDKSVALSQLILNQDEYCLFYEKLFGLQRNPSVAIGKVIRNLTSYKYRLRYEAKLDEVIDELVNHTKHMALAMPTQEVIDSTYIFTEVPSRRIQPYYMSNSLSKYIRYNILTGNIVAMNDNTRYGYNSNLYPFLNNLDQVQLYSVPMSFFEEENIDRRIFNRYTNNPFLVINEYIQKYNQFPTRINKVVSEENKHIDLISLLSEEFYNKFTYQSIESMLTVSDDYNDIYNRAIIIDAIRIQKEDLDLTLDSIPDEDEDAHIVNDTINEFLIADGTYVGHMYPCEICAIVKEYNFFNEDYMLTHFTTPEERSRYMRDKPTKLALLQSQLSKICGQKEGNILLNVQDVDIFDISESEDEEYNIWDAIT